MTLEQLKNRQEYINEQLYTLLNNTEGVMNTIIGEQPVADEKTLEIPQPSGLLQEINREQDISEMYIEKLSGYNRQLVNHTYDPDRPE